ncbi:MULTISPECIES: glycerophosphodiester phosphodiesterase [unclassified Nocardioides]|uniref:glycerophosphodiester phosphodiesterase n=1 Tax=unclassified Nocardioides TaxID=2615069 RepID=UPI0000571118|nr:MULTISPECIES: glycerophosphodiester phosphodiesterase [unclassified Nocardioides]ABL82087.1 glycerophosphoryl diester phosphodiesterase [Nocardioides sp. JS614]
MTLVSAHRCLTHAAIEAAIALGADYVEFDVQRIADGSLVLLHDLVDDPPAGTLRYDEALALLAGRARAHLDLKLRGGEIPIVTEAIARLGTDRLLVTTHHDEAVRALRAWADREGHDLQVGLSLGQGVKGFSLWHAIRVRASELFPGVRYRAAGANVVVAHHWLARLRVRRFARRHRLPLVVWTVDTPRSLAHWMRPGRAWLVTTNQPQVALDLRAGRLRA